MVRLWSSSPAGNLPAPGQKSAGEGLGARPFEGHPRFCVWEAAGSWDCRAAAAPTSPAAQAAEMLLVLLGTTGAAAERTGAVQGRGQQQGAILKPACKCHPSTSAGTRHRQTCAGSCPDSRLLPLTDLRTGTTLQGHSPLVHPPPLPTAFQNSPGAPRLCQPRAFSILHRGIDQHPLFPPPRRKRLLPSCPAPLCQPQLVGRARGRQDRAVLGLSVRLSVCPAAVLLRALTSALPAAGRWAGGTAPIVLKIIQRSTNSLQISVTARRN